MTSPSWDDACLTSEVLAERGQPEPRLLRGFSAYLVAKNKRISTILKEDPNLIQLKRGLFARNRSNNGKAWMSYVNTSGILLLIPRRDITKLSVTAQDELGGMRRRFVLIIHNSLQTELLRKQFSRILERTPVIRVRPGLLLAPQIPTSRYRKYEGVLQRPSKLLTKLASLGSPVWYVPRVEIIHPKAHEVIEGFMRTTIEHRARRIVQMCKKLYIDLKQPPEGLTHPTVVQKRLNRIKRHLRYLRWQSRFFKEELGMDLQMLVNRALSAASRVQKQVKKM
ncbi:MAG: hypothetical protein ACFE89_10475 [Candidatus Hodarchaeota archaeon]